MKKQALVIGLGQFGMTLSYALSKQGIEVLAVDIDSVRVETAAVHVAEAAEFDATDESDLLRAVPSSKDVCVCAIGPASKENAILVTSLLRQMGAKHIIARASDNRMERILTLVGAHEVVNPERDFGERLAKRMAHRGLLEQVPLGANLVITEISPPPRMLGRTLVELCLPKHYGVSVVGIREPSSQGGHLVIPHSQTVISKGDILVVVSTPESITRLLEETR